MVATSAGGNSNEQYFTRLRLRIDRPRFMMIVFRDDFFLRRRHFDHFLLGGNQSPRRSLSTPVSALKRFDRFLLHRRASVSARPLRQKLRRHAGTDLAYCVAAINGGASGIGQRSLHKSA
jgi:hypothetical protein